jgi:signal transduction histidine kinase
VHDLLDLAKLESREFSMAIEPVDLADVVGATVEGFLPEADEGSLSIDVRVPDAPVVINGDTDRLAQLTGNLVQNALKFAVSRVVVAVRLDQHWARLDVMDDGPGIASEDLPHVFERLYVARRQPERREAGSGLGLAIVRELVTAMHGVVRASAAVTEDATMSGACLTVFLPLARSPAGPPSSGSTTTANPTTVTTTATVATSTMTTTTDPADSIETAGSTTPAAQAPHRPTSPG